MSRMLRGAFDPAGAFARDRLDVEHVFVAANDPEWAGEALRGIAERGRAAFLTIEPWQPVTDDDLARWAVHLWRASRPVHVRYQHEMNGSWGYPWQGDPERHRRDWTAFARAMPANVVRVWSPNVAYPGSRPIVDFWPGAEYVDAIGVDGYARDGETPAEVFEPTRLDLAAIAPGTPLMIAETAAPRGPRQKRYAEALVGYGRSRGLAACVWFNANKSGQGPDEADWRLSPAARRAFLGREG